MQIALTAALSLLAPPGAAPAAPKAAPAVSAARAPLDALLTLRGLLYALRLELRGRRTGALRDAPPLPLGRFAALAARPRMDLERGRGLAQVVAAAEAITSTPEARPAVKAAFRTLAVDAALKPGAPAPATPAAGVDAAEIDALAALIRTQALALADAAPGVAASAKQLAPEARRLVAAVPRSKPTDVAARTGLTLAPSHGVFGLAPMRDDAALAGMLLKDCDAELRALAPAVKAAWRKASAPPDLAALADRLPREDFAAPLADLLNPLTLPAPPVPLDPDAVCRVLWDASCARLTTCNGAIEKIVLSPTVCEEGADALIDACRARSPGFYAAGTVDHAGLRACVEAWAARPCDEVCGRAAPAPATCEPFAPGLAPSKVECGEVRDEVGEDGLGE